MKGMRGEKLNCGCGFSGINLFISAFTFGGGYVVVPMIRKYFVFQKKLFSEEELMNMAAIALVLAGGHRCESVCAGRMHRAAGVLGDRNQRNLGGDTPRWSSCQ